MLDFTYEPAPVRVVFAAGAVAALPDECDRLGLRRPVVVCTPGQAGTVRELTAGYADRVAGYLPRAVMHVPVAVADDARAAVRDLDADGLVAFGGGSAVGLAKAVALTEGLPILAVPTTYAGSEMTPVWGLTEAGVKRTGRDPRVRPRTVIYDPDLTRALPAGVAGPSGMNALAHAVEALYAPDRSPPIELLAREGIRALGTALPALVAAPDDEHRAQALYGAWLCGTCLGGTAMSLHHKLCHVLGGTFDLPHAGAHAVILPHALAYNAAHAPDADAAVARALGEPGGAGAAALHRLAAAAGAPRSLAALGMREQDLDRAADLATRDPYANPRPVTRAGVRTLLQHAYDGERRL
ncbi:maleylacetate reductase [Phytohabitans rumicis]|uniref:Maleylacetate reductase n=1 Tax=Phytohabitans rumicis TaxID=1076125 RepID=A0A6V8KN84_9ACTN|nr:maleylacetate reductase [Phytohabitans rumicis]